MASAQHGADSDQQRLLAILHRLLGLQPRGLQPALVAAVDALAEAMAVEKVDVFLPSDDGTALVAGGTSATPMGRRQQQRGLDRLAIHAGGWAVATYLNGHNRLTGHLENEPDERPEIVEQLGVRSQIAVALEAAGRRCGVLLICSAEPERFDGRDLRFAESVAHWLGLVADLNARVEQMVGDAAEAGLRASAEETARELTRRQREVAALIAAGKSNKEIAEELVLVEGTVANHVEAILSRLGFRSRTQVAVWALERGLRHEDRE